jgi:hypothetical protein
MVRAQGYSDEQVREAVAGYSDDELYNLNDPDLLIGMIQSMSGPPRGETPNGFSSHYSTASRDSFPQSQPDGFQQYNEQVHSHAGQALIYHEAVVRSGKQERVRGAEIIIVATFPLQSKSREIAVAAGTTLHELESDLCEGLNIDIPHGDMLIAR